ncbi:MAG TPA: AzlD domain-containing protein [Euzebyales bacterium]|nr:AzlD domain-containing protein [Euzebyales bacterium]
MIEPATAWMVIIGGGIVTYLVRAVLLTVAHRARDLPPRVRDGLRMIPPAALAALVAPAVLRPDGGLLLWHPRPLAGLVAAAVAWRTRSVVATLLVGGAALAGLTALGVGA